MYARTKLTALAFAGALALTACGGGGGSSTTTAVANTAPTTSAATPTSTTSSAAATDTSTGLPRDLGGCMEAASIGLSMAGVGLDGLGGKFDQAAFDKAFPAGTVDKLPQELKDPYTAAETAAKDIIGKTGTEAMNATTAYTDKLTAYSDALGKVCS